MTIEIKKSVDELSLEITGRLDTITAPVLEKTINENLGEIKSLILDLKHLEYISSAGLRVLLSAQKKLQQNGAMKLKNVCEDVMGVFEITGFADILAIE
jgi:anti-sigma B factor antagonist